MPEEQPAVPQVFAVEDNPGDVRLVEEGIAEAGEIDLHLEHNGSRAIERLQSGDGPPHTDHLDLILLDLNLPGKSGFEVLAAVRTESTRQDVPVVVVSSSQNDDDIDRAYADGANAYVTKPADPDAYIRMVTAAVGFWIGTVADTPNQ